MTSQAFEFDGPRGYRLAGRLELPDGQPLGWAILAHCFTCGKDGLASTRLARAMASRGIGVLRLLSRRVDADYAAAMISTWASRYLISEP